MTEAKKVTAALVEAKLTVWQQRLDLRHWDVRLDFDTEPDVERAVAEIACHEQYDRATIYLAPGWREWSADGEIGELKVTLDYLLVHELTHALMRDLDQPAMNDLDKLAHPDALSVFIEVYHRQRERLTDRLATVILNGWGPA
jgi:hypothetical protein